MLLKLQMGFPVEQEILLLDNMEDLVVNAATSTMATMSLTPVLRLITWVWPIVEGAKLNAQPKTRLSANGWCIVSE